MIRSEAEYQTALKRLEEHQDFALRQKSALEAQGFREEEVTRAMEALVSFQAQIVEDIDWYDKIRRRNFEPIHGLTNVGCMLIGLRIANGWSQKQLADALGVAESVVSRDERNEYHSITLERAQRIIAAFGASVTITVGDPGTGDSPLRIGTRAAKDNRKSTVKKRDTAKRNLPA